jgi:hypothetical protein
MRLTVSSKIDRTRYAITGNIRIQLFNSIVTKEDQADQFFMFSLRHCRYHKSSNVCRSLIHVRIRVASVDILTVGSTPNSVPHLLLDLKMLLCGSKSYRRNGYYVDFTSMSLSSCCVKTVRYCLKNGFPPLPMSVQLLIMSSLVGMKMRVCC